MIKKKESNQEDKKTWEDYIKNPSDIYDKDKNLSNNSQRRDRYKFDLHGFTLDEANKKVKDLIYKAYEDGISKLIIVTGKGIHSDNDKDPYVSKDLGILKNSVPEYIKNNRELMSMINGIQEANIEDGGTGAFYIFLKKKL